MPLTKRARRLLATALITTAVLAAGLAASIYRALRQPAEPLDMGPLALAVLNSPEQVDLFALRRDAMAAEHGPGDVHFEGFRWSRGGGTPVPHELFAEAQRAVLTPDNYQLHPQADLCDWSPPWALRFRRGDAFVDVLVQDDCRRDSISDVAHGGPTAAGAPAKGGGKLTKAGSEAFHELLTRIISKPKTG